MANKNCENSSLNGQCPGSLTFFGQNHATIPLLTYEIILKHQEKVINQFLKEEQIMLQYLYLFIK